uniref:(northern house mosquito) hypothetical protein n=1 Tax=Culex pipiens TaxID=7175 RepID=A0A8D8BDX4_CULPI
MNLKSTRYSASRASFNRFIPNEVISSRSTTLFLNAANFASTAEGRSCPWFFFWAKRSSLNCSSVKVTLIGAVDVLALFLPLEFKRLASWMASSLSSHPTEAATFLTRSVVFSPFIVGSPRITILLVIPALVRRSTSSSSWFTFVLTV